MSKNIRATIEILEHYHHNGGFYEIPVEIINTVEQELEEQDKEIERLKNMIKAEEKISELLPDDTDFIIVRRKDYNRLFGSDKE